MKKFFVLAGLCGVPQMADYYRRQTNAEAFDVWHAQLRREFGALLFGAKRDLKTLSGPFDARYPDIHVFTCKMIAAYLCI